MAHDLVPNIRDLPFPAPLTAFLHHPLDRYRYMTDLDGKHVLLVGYSDDQAAAFAQNEKVASAVRITLWSEHIDMEGSKFPVVVGNICNRTEFADNTFDAVVFMAVFEHLANLNGAFQEVRRILRDGGRCISEFGPVWTGATGHHLYLDPGHPVLDFTQRQLPSHLHLLYNHKQIVDYFVWRGIAKRFAEQSAEFILKGDIPSRVPIRDYFQAARRHFRVLLQENYTSPVSDVVLHALAIKSHTEYAEVEGGFWCMIADK